MENFRYHFFKGPDTILNTMLYVKTITKGSAFQLFTSCVFNMFSEKDSSFHSQLAPRYSICVRCQGSEQQVLQRWMLSGRMSLWAKLLSWVQTNTVKQHKTALFSALVQKLFYVHRPQGKIFCGELIGFIYIFQDQS